MGNFCLMSTEFPFCKKKKVQDMDRVVVAEQCECT